MRCLIGHQLCQVGHTYNEYRCINCGVEPRGLSKLFSTYVPYTMENINKVYEANKGKY